MVPTMVNLSRLCVPNRFQSNWFLAIRERCGHTLLVGQQMHFCIC